MKLNAEHADVRAFRQGLVERIPEQGSHSDVQSPVIRGRHESGASWDQRRPGSSPAINRADEHERQFGIEFAMLVGQVVADCPASKLSHLVPDAHALLNQAFSLVKG